MRLLAAAGKGDGETQCRLWRAYSSGKGVMRDETETLKWLQRAAVQGHAEARPYDGMDGCFTEQRFEGRKVVPQGRHGHVITVISIEIPETHYETAPNKSVQWTPLRGATSLETFGETRSQ